MCRGYIFGGEDRVSQQLGVCGCFIAVHMELDLEGARPSASKLDVPRTSLPNDPLHKTLSLEVFIQKTLSEKMASRQGVSVKKPSHYLASDRRRARQIPKGWQRLNSTTMLTRHRESKQVRGCVR